MIFFRFEDGIFFYLEIIVLCYAFKVFEKLIGLMFVVLNYIYSLVLYIYNEMCVMKYFFGKFLCKIYCKIDFKDEIK